MWNWLVLFIDNAAHWLSITKQNIFWPLRNKFSAYQTNSIIVIISLCADVLYFSTIERGHKYDSEHTCILSLSLSLWSSSLFFSAHIQNEEVLKTKQQIEYCAYLIGVLVRQSNTTFCLLGMMSNTLFAFLIMAFSCFTWLDYAESKLPQEEGKKLRIFSILVPCVFFCLPASYILIYIT